MSQLARAYAFLDKADMAGTCMLASSVGAAVFHQALPRRLDSNFLRVDHEADPETVRAEAERLGRQMIFVPDSELGEQLVPFFQGRGWRVNRVVVMAQVREAERDGDLDLVREVREEDLRSARARLNAGQPWGKPEVMEQLFAGKRWIAEHVEAHFFAVFADGEVVSYTDLYQDGTEAQVEDVGTLTGHRGRGYATAVVVAAIASARERGAEFIFLVADKEDWPKELYRRLGFDELGYYVKFVSPQLVG